MVIIMFPIIMPLTSAELKEINLGNTRPRKKVDIEVLKATNCSLKS